jgi:hypothetical protein
MADEMAQWVEGVLRKLPKDKEFAYRQLLVQKSPTELNPGERSDVSWISTETMDRVGEVVLAAGMDDRHYRLNPLVTLSHDYKLPPVGRSVWRKRVRDGSLVGIKAKTIYPRRPESLPTSESWLSDQVFAMIQTGLLMGKSIGFLPVKIHGPSREEREREGWSEVKLVIDEWVLLEYACVSLPANPQTLVEVVSKSARVRVDVRSTVRAAIRDGLERLRGRV